MTIVFMLVHPKDKYLNLLKIFHFRIKLIKLALLMKIITLCLDLSYIIQKYQKIQTIILILQINLVNNV